MSTTESVQPGLPRVLGAFSVVLGAAFLSFALILLSLLRSAPGSWVLVGMALLAALKGYLALIGGARLVRNPETTLIRPAEWRMVGVGYCLVAALVMAGAVGGEGWGYAVAGALFGGIAPVWFTVARHVEGNLKKSSVASNSNSAVAGDGGEHRS